MMMTEESGYWYELDWETFRRYMKEKIDMEFRLYRRCLRKAEEAENDAERSYYIQMANRHYEAYFADRLMLENAESLKDECLFFYDAKECVPVCVRVGRTLKRERERRLREIFQTLYR